MLLRRNFHIFFPTVFLKSVKYRCKLKPWSNGLASSRKLKTWVYLRIRLARPCVHLRRLAMTCDHFGRDQICPQVNASFLPFGHPSQVNVSSVTEPVALKWLFFFCDFRALARKLASPFGHPTQVSSQVQLAATCDYLRVRLTRA